MEGTQSPKYSSDSFIPFPSEAISHRNYRLPRNESINEHNQIPGPNVTLFSDTNNVPWKKKSTYSIGVMGLHQEIGDFWERMRPTEEEREIRLRVVEHITRTVHSMWPQADVQIFGSFRTGLYLPSSDIDMVIIGEWKSLPLQTLSQALQQNGISESDITIIARAKVPIIRLKHTPSRVKVDISFNMTNGIQGALLIKSLIKKYPPLPKLVLVLKQFLLQRGLNEVYNGGMSSYCLTLLIVSLLQSYHKPKTTLPSKNLGTLLLEFFEHYGVNFNYERVSIHFENEGNYRPKYRCDRFLSVEDPLSKGNDIGKGTFLINVLRVAFENTFLVLHKAVTDSAANNRPLNSYLSLIINVEEQLWNDRWWLTQNYSSIIGKLSELGFKNNEVHDSEGQSSKDTKNFKKKIKIENAAKVSRNLLLCHRVMKKK